MRVFTILAMTMLCIGANAAGASEANSVAAGNFTCAELKSLVQSNGEVTIQDSLGDWQVYANGVACYQQGMHSKFKSMRAGDGWCVVGLVCDPYFGGM